MIISSRENKKVKQWVKYHHKKFRDKDNKFLVEGEHLVEEAIQSNSLATLIVREGINNKFDFEDVCYVSNDIIDELSVMTSKNDYIGVCNKSNITIDLANSSRFIILDNVQDPGNVGTIIRTAYSFGYDGIIVGNDCCDIYNEKVISATQGAIFNIPTYRCNLMNEINVLKDKGFYIYGTDLKESKFLSELVKYPTKLAIIVGNEGQGVKESILELTDQNIKIEMQNFESLNVAVAASICMYVLKK